jgi:stage IV sporulation protein FB
MGWEDRPYYRDHSRSASSPLMWLVSGSIPLFTLFGIRVRAHVSMLFFILWTVLVDAAAGYPIQARAFSMGLFFLIIVLHEFGHCFMARWLGGTADDILIWPLGGLAFASAPRRPLPTFLTAAAGPMVNVLICALCAAGFRAVTGVWLSPNPFHVTPHLTALNWSSAAYYLSWIYFLSFILLIFNLLPIYPLDGGQMVQAILWPMTGYYRSMLISTTVGMVGSAVLGIYFLIGGQLFLTLLAVMLFYNNFQQRMILRETGSEDWSDGGEYAASLYGQTGPAPSVRRRLRHRRAIKRARKIAQQEANERQRIDTILAKVSAHGMHSLNWFERRALRKATERQRKRDLELSRYL